MGDLNNSQTGGNGPTARITRLDARLAELEQAHQRLQDLYEISKQLARFESLDRTLPRVIATIARSLSLTNAIFIVETDRGPRTLIWQAKGADQARLRSAKRHAQTAYGYLVRPGLDLGGDDARPLALPSPLLGERVDSFQAGPEFVILPLVVAHGSIFGALQVSRSVTWDERDLIFVNAVVNQVAVAIERQAAIRSNQDRVEAGEREQRLLAGVTAVLGSCLEYRRTLSGLAEFAVSFLADICVIDVMEDNGSLERLEVLFADKEKQSQMADRVKRFSPQVGWQTPQAKVLASGKSVLLRTVTHPAPEGIAQNAEHAEAMRASGITSMMAVPLSVRGHIIGVLTICTAAPERRFSEKDVALVEEIAQRSAIAIDNARLYQQAKRATAARDNTMAVVSHDLRNSLSVIDMSLAALLNTSIRDDRENADRQLGIIRRASLTMNRLLQDLLETASIDAGRLSLDPKPVETALLVCGIVETLKSSAGARSIDLKSELTGELPAVYADGARIEQVLANLVGNAIKFTPDGGSVVVRAERFNDAIRFSVIDTGPGIPSEDLSQIFDRFWRAKQASQFGTGLGLFIVKGIVENHGGQVWAESVVGRGTSLFFTLPLAPRPNVLAAPAADGAEAPVTRLSRRRRFPAQQGRETS